MIIKENRVERHVINKNHPMFDMCNEYTKKSKNLYNFANYIVRQEFINNNKFIRYSDLWKMLKSEEVFKDIGSNSGQHTLKILERNWKSFFVAIKDWSKNPQKYLGKPKIPKYLDKDKGRFICVFTNWQTQIKDGYLFFAFKPFKPFNNLIRTKIKGKHMQSRINPRIGDYVFEIVYEVELPEMNNNENRVIGIDLGLNNLCTIQNNFSEKPIVINGKPLKSINQFYNKEKAKIQSKFAYTKFYFLLYHEIPVYLLQHITHYSSITIFTLLTFKCGKYLSNKSFLDFPLKLLVPSLITV